MTQEKVRHRKIRFGRDDQLDLSRLPSAFSPLWRRVMKRCAGILHNISKAILLLFCTLFIIVGIVVAILATTGISNPYFASLAQSSVQQIAGEDLIATIGDAGMSLDGEGNLAVHAKAVTFTKASNQAKLADIESIRIGLKALPLLLGKIELARVEVDDVLIGQLAEPAASYAWLETIKRGDGLYDPGSVPILALDTIDKLRSQFEARHLKEIVATNVRFISSTNPPTSELSIASVSFAKGQSGAIALTGKINKQDQKLVIAGQIDANGFDLSVNGLSYGEKTLSQVGGALEESATPITPNANFNITLRGHEIDALARLQVELNVERFDFRNRRGARILGNGNIRAELIENVDKIEIQPSQITIGSNAGIFTGAIGLDVTNNEISPSYRFEIISNEASLNPKDSSEKRIAVAIGIVGTMNAEMRAIKFSQIEVRTLSGQVFGKGDLTFAAGSPEMNFLFDIPEMSTSSAKQLWPSIFARGARLWVLDHVYGGTLKNSTIRIAYKAGSLWPRMGDTPLPLPTAEQVSADFSISNARFDLLGDLPPVREADGLVSVRGANTTIKLEKGITYLEDGKSVRVASGTMTIPVTLGKPIIADLEIDVIGEAAALANLADKDPIRALSKAPISATDLSGTAVAHITASFPLRKSDKSIGTKWNAEVDFKNLSIEKEFNGQKLNDAEGTLSVSKSSATFTAKGKLNGVPAKLVVVEPLIKGQGKRDISAKLMLDDKARAKIAPGLKEILTGPIDIELSSAGDTQMITADLTDATLSLPFAGWAKGAGISGKATFAFVKTERGTSIKDLLVQGKSFSLSGDVDLVGGALSKARFSKVSLNKGDNIAVDVVNSKDGLDVSVSGKSLDLRSLLKKVSDSFEKTAAVTSGVPIRIVANIDEVTGFNDEQLRNVVASYRGKGSTIRFFAASANTMSGSNVAIENTSNSDNRNVTIQAADGGALLRFMDLYDKMYGGTVNIRLQTNGDGPLIGEVDAKNFNIVGEARLKSLAGAPATPDGQSLASVTQDKLEVSKVRFERGNALIEKGKGYLKLDKGILRSEQIGLSYSGTLYDGRGNIDMVGTFMPAFGLNRMFGELPFFGELLGNGRDKGLIGITFKLDGNAKSPQLTVNPVSLIAPGIFRQIFEFQ